MENVIEKSEVPKPVTFPGEDSVVVSIYLLWQLQDPSFHYSKYGYEINIEWTPWTEPRSSEGERVIILTSRMELTW